MSTKHETRVHRPLPLYLTMLNSGAAGCIAWLFSHPFEVIKNKVILAPHTQPLSECLGEAYKGGLYKGLSGGIARQVVYATCRLGFYDPVKNIIVRGPEPTVLERALAGALSGAMASFLSSPVEVCLVMQTKSSTKLSLLSAAKNVFNDGGITAYWRGVIPLMMRASVVGISQVAMYDQLRTMIEKWNKEKNKGMSRGSIVVYASSLTGLFYAFITMPIELSRVRMSAFQKSATCDKPPGMIKVLGNVVKTEGVGSIFRSFIPYYARCSAHTVACFFILEQFTRRTKEYRDGWK